jgi:PfaB family protein
MQKIAIIGLSCLFHATKNPEEYWKNLIGEKDLKNLATTEEMGVNAHFFYDSVKGKPDKSYCLNGGYIRDWQFDTNGYQLAPELLKGLDKIYQWSLYVAKQALQDSGYLANLSVLEKGGVILGNLSFPTRFSHGIFAPIYQKVLNSTLQQLLQKPSFQLKKSSGDVYPLNGILSGYPAAVIAQALSLSSINLCLDAACASSLYAIKLACQYLSSGKADLMLAGAVSCADPLFVNTGFSILQAYPEDGISRPLDKSSRGLIAGEGAGMVVLKRYSDALRDGDRIYATITGIGLSNDGQGKSVLSPNAKGQILAFERAYTDAGINPNSIDYIECHATGTSIGDIIELNSIDSFFGQYQAVPLIGSVKSNLGHLLTAAGMAGLIKVILSMTKGLIPPTINITEPLTSDKGVIKTKQIVSSTIPWPHKRPKKHAAVSAFGFGGTNAHLILELSEEMGSTPEAENLKTTDNPIQNRLAIVGMDAFFGSCNGLDAFDRTIYEAKQHFIPLPPQRWQGIEAQPQLLKEYGLAKAKAPLGAYIQDFELDFLHFKIPPRDEDRLIPQQLLMLKVADNAITDAKLDQGGNVAVIVAMGTELSLHQYRGRCDLSWQIKESLEQANIYLSLEEIVELENIAKDSLNPPAQVNRATSFIGNIMASRISALWDFSGPSFTISAEENSVFKALEVAQLLLSNKEVDAVVVGAVDLSGGFENVLFRNQLAPINTGINTLSYDKNANGWMVGEGAGAVVLKLHETAKQKQDRIYAVIDAISLVQDNDKGKSVHAISRKLDAKRIAQACEQAFEVAEIKPTNINYLEVFGSGVAEEDNAEIKGLLAAYQSQLTTFENSQSTSIIQNQTSKITKINSCCLGSVKANIGHTYVASGMASLIKTALCLYHRYIPGTPQWSRPKNPTLWEGSPFYIVTESRTWFLEEGASKRIAAINGLGIDGTYSHLILSEELSQKERSSKYLEQTPFYIFPLTADNQLSLLDRLNLLQNRIETCECLSVVAIQTFTVFQQSAQATYTLAILGSNKEELLQEINLAITGINKAFETGREWKTPLGSYFTAKPLGKRGKIAFVYPGMGSSNIGVGRNIFRLFPKVYDTFSTLTSNVAQVIHEQLLYPRSLEKLSSKGQAEKLAQFFSNGLAMCQNGVSFAVLYTLILKECFQVQPQIAFGYSLGETSSMLFALGVWQDDGNLNKALDPSLFKTELCGPCLAIRKFWGLPQTVEMEHDEKFWISYILKASVSVVEEVLKHEKRVYIIFINTPEELVIAGEPKSCWRVIQTLQCKYFPINFDSLLHCEVAQSKYDELVEMHTIPIRKVLDVQFYSAIDFAPIPLNTNNLAHNAAKLCCQTVNFPRLINCVYKDGARIFIELGSGNNCSRWIDETLNQNEHVAMSINTKEVDDHTGVVRVLAKLVSHGVSVNLSPLYEQNLKSSIQHQSIIKKVTLGGISIPSKILSAKNYQKFQNEIKIRKQEIEINRITDNQQLTTNNQQQMMKILQIQIAVAQQLLNPNNSVHDNSHPVASASVTNHHTKTSQVVWDEADLLEFAEGKISRIFGQNYEIIDSYSRRVRLPMPPYLLVSRVTKINGERGKFKPCSITTEYDIPHKAWYSVDSQVPLAIAVESGQCDLLLISYLGIDFENKGNLVYRLLGCTLKFLDDLPKQGETLRYEIKINSFVRNGENLLFFFSYECFVGEKMILKMDEGCAGFFSDKQLEQGRGVVFSDQELEERSKIQKQTFEPLLVCQKSTFDESDMLHLTEGNIAACFGDHYCQYGLNPSLRLPPKAILMVDRVTLVEPTGGAWGLGLIIAEKFLDPEHWYFPCHFKDDQVLAGSLMGEGCSQLLQFYLLYLGLQTCTTDARFQPIPGLPQVVRCRGQVTPISAKLIYRMEITEIGITPKPYAKCNVEIILNDKIIVHFKNLGLHLSQKNLSH